MRSVAHEILRLVFGGHQMGTATNETWYWNGSKWSTIAAKGPSARTFNGMTTDVQRKRVYLYGGSAEAGGESLADLWYLDNRTTWVRVQPRN